jgi:hypothetical protein
LLSHFYISVLVPLLGRLSRLSQLNISDEILLNKELCRLEPLLTLSIPRDLFVRVCCANKTSAIQVERSLCSYHRTIYAEYIK